MKTSIKARKKRIPSWDEIREMFQETDRKMQETDKQIKETEKIVQEISTTDGDNFTLEPSDRKSLKRF